MARILVKGWKNRLEQREAQKATRKAQRLQEKEQRRLKQQERIVQKQKQQQQQNLKPQQQQQQQQQQQTTPKVEQIRQQSPSSSQDKWEPLITLKTKDGKIVSVSRSQLPKLRGEKIEEMINWFESTYVWIPGTFKRKPCYDCKGKEGNNSCVLCMGSGRVPDGVVAMTVGHIDVSLARRGESNFKKQQKPVPDHLKKLGVRDEGTALGTYLQNVHTKRVVERPDQFGQIHLQEGDRIFAYSKWVPIWWIYDTKFYKELKKKWNKVIDERNREYVRKSTSTNDSMISKPKALPSIEELQAFASERLVGNERSRGMQNAGPVSRALEELH